MKDEKIELVRGSGNVFRDLGHASPDVEQLKAILAAEIIKMLDRKQLTVRAAHAETGIAAADFSRIRNADLARFTRDLLGAQQRPETTELANEQGSVRNCRFRWQILVCHLRDTT